MAFIINVGLDHELPLMAWANIYVLYPHDYVLTPKQRMVRATENKVHYLINRAIVDIRECLLSTCKAADYLDFRNRVIERLCSAYGFIFLDGSTRTILREEVEDLLESPVPRITPAS